jgi:hypothetical protein
MTPFVFLINYFIERILIAFSVKKFRDSEKILPLNPPPKGENSILLLFHNRLKGNIPFFEVPEGKQRSSENLSNDLIKSK